MTRRDGVTLVEALMAIFATAIGLLSLLVLFPLGAIKMAEAINMDRAGHLRDNAFALTEAFDIRNDPSVIGGGSNYYVNPDNGVPGGLPDLSATGYDGPSYPVYIDPLGIFTQPARLGASPTSGTPGFARRPLSFTTSPQLALHWFALQDDIAFVNNDASPAGDPYLGLAAYPPTSTATVNRTSRFTVAYLARRPRAADNTVVDLSVVVYKSRPTTSGGEATYGSVLFNTANPEVSVNWTGQAKPEIRKGSWVLDATVLAPDAASPGGRKPEPHGYFYRVVNVTDDPVNPNTVILELQDKPRQNSFVMASGQPVPYGVLVVMENVIEVFEKGSGWKP